MNSGIESGSTDETRNIGSIYQIINNHFGGGGTATKKSKSNSRGNTMIEGPLVQTTKVVRIPIVTSPNSQIENGHD